MASEIDWRKIKEGNKAVFNELFDRYYMSMCSFISSYVEDGQQVEDIVVDCFVRIWESRKSLEIKTSVQNFLITMVRNSAIDYLRKNKFNYTDLKEIILSLPDEIESPLEDARIMNKLYLAINRLPEQRRKILKMAAFEEKSYNEIALELNISINTVKTQMSRSYKFLKEELDVTARTIQLLLFS